MNFENVISHLHPTLSVNRCLTCPLRTPPMTRLIQHSYGGVLVPLLFLFCLFTDAVTEDPSTCPVVHPAPLCDRCGLFLNGTLPNQARGPLSASTTAQQWRLRTSVPPLLVSQPGAGNTMARLLLEYVTGLRTGKYKDNVQCRFSANFYTLVTALYELRHLMLLLMG